MRVLEKIKGFKKNRDLNNIIFSLMAYVIIPFGTIISTPILIKYLGLEDYGYWILINSIIAIMGISNFGLGNSIIKFGSKYIKLNESTKYKDLISTTLFMTLVISVALVLISIVMDLFFVNILDEFKEINTPFTLITVIVSLKIISGIFSSIIMSYQRYDITNKINIIVNLILIFISTLIAVYSSKLEYLITVLLCVTIISLVVHYFKARQILGGIQITLRFEKTVFKSILSFGGFSWLQSIISIVYNQVDKIIVSVMLGPQMLGVYTACLQIALKIHEIPTAAGAFLFPKFSESLEEGSSAYKKLYINASILLLLFLFIFSFPLFIFAEEILELWIDEEFSNSYSQLLKALIVSISSGTLFVIPFYFLNGLGYVRLNTTVNGALSIVSVISTIILIPYLDILGAAYGRLMGLPIIIFIIIYIIENKILKEAISLKIFSFLIIWEAFFIIPIYMLERYLKYNSVYAFISIVFIIIGIHCIYSIPVFKLIKKRFKYETKSK